MVRGKQWLAGAFTLMLLGAGNDAVAQVAPLAAGRNVNMVAGTKWPDGDPYLQRQNEPSVAASTRNPLHLLAGANDYRTVDIPFVNDADETGDAWLGLFKSLDGGQRWKTTLLPGYPQDTSTIGMASPLKGYGAGADPVVRAGTSGLLYYSGLVFDRTDDGTGRSAIFVARFIDNNDREAGDPIKYLGTSLVASSPGGTDGVFLDKPWMVVDIPRGNAGTCRITTTDVDPLTQQTRTVTQTIPAGPAYVAYTAFSTDAQGERSDIYFTSSTNCGRTWSNPTRVNRREDRVNQGVTLAVDPRNGDVLIAWRQFAPTASADGDGLMAARYNASSRRCLPPGLVRKLSSSKHSNILHRIREKRRTHQATTGPRPVGDELESFDQATTDIGNAISFRTNAYPTLAIDGSGRAYMAWTERGFGTARPSPIDGDARIVMATSTNGTTWSTPRPIADETTVDQQPIPGHQIMPTLTMGGGRLVLVYYDLRDDVSQQFSQFVDDRGAIQMANRRRTLDLRASFATPAAVPAFAPSVRVSDYLMTQEITPAGTLVERQLQYNAPNLPMFKQGTAPFMGDYVDVTTAPAFVPTTNGRWAYNTTGQAVFHAVWTDNRDVRQPGVDTNNDGNPWNDYTAPTQRAEGSASIFGPGQTLPQCNPANTGSRNQNIYTARLSAGLIVGSPGNTKPLSTSLARAFSVFAQNTTTQVKTFRLTIGNQPVGGRASFDQFSAQPLVSVDVTTAPRSLAARTVYVTSSRADAQVSVSVREIASVGGALVSGGLGDVIVLNPDIANPDIANPDIANPDIANPDIANPDIANAEVYNPDIANPDIANPDIANPDIANPDIANPDIANPDIANPDIANPDIANVRVANPDIANPDIANPDIANPDIANPDIANPDIANPDIANTTLTDVTWTITNTGNTAASFNVNLFLAQATNKICASGQTPTDNGCIATQLILHKVYTTPTALACEVQVQSQNVLIANISNPRFVTPGTGATTANDPSINNATLWLAPGEVARITLRIADPNRNDNASVGGATIDPVFFPTNSGQGGVLTPFVTQQAINTTSIGAGGTITRYPASVFFVQQPTTTPVGFAMAPPVSVQVRDQLGAPLAGASVTLALLPSTAAGAVITGGDATTTDANGIATFAALQVDLAGSAYQLEVTVIDASATTAESISNTSVPFDVPLAVVNVNDAGAGSLRYALEQANASTGRRETIVFAIPGAGPHTIAPATELPAIVDPVVIDARTQAGYSPLTPAVVVSGAAMPGPFVNGGLIDVTADNTEVRGLSVRSSGTNGIRVRGDNVRVSENVIASSFASGVFVEGGTGTTIAGNVIGLSAGGLLPSLPNGVGIEVTEFTGTAAANLVVDDNIVSGNTSAGIALRAAAGGPVDTTITRNLIGLDATGSVMAGNGSAPDQLGGLVIEAGPGTQVGTLGNGNVIGGNFGPGISVGALALPSTATGVTIEANYIGTNAASLSLGNTLGGVVLANAATNLVGGDAQVAGTENVIWFNGAAGISVTGGASTGNTFRFNSISGNTGIGIDLGATGVTPNDGDADADAGPNGLQNFPVLQWAQNDVLPGVTTVGFTLGAAPGNYRVRIYSNATCDASGNGEGERQEDTSLIAHPGGTVTYQVDLVGPAVTGPIAAGRFVTLTATNLNTDDTSEFSNCAVVVTPASGSFFVPGTAGGTANLNNLGDINFPAGAGGTAPVGTGLLLSPGSSVSVTATGQFDPSGGAGLTGPDGQPGPDWAIGYFLDPTLTRLSLVARIGTGPWQFVGVGPTVLTAGGAGGELEFAINDSLYSDNSGGLDVAVVQLAQVTLGDLAAVFDGNPKPVSVVTTPVGLSTSVTYDGSATVPSAVGSYAVVATVTAPGYVGTASDTLVISGGAPIVASIAITSASAVFDGFAKPVSVVTAPVPGLSYAATYDGSPIVPSAIGAYLVSATITDPGYTPAATSAIHKIASTLAAGGNGGTPYARYCGAGVFANGFGVSPPNNSLWSAQLLCSDAAHPATFGNTDTPPFNTPDTVLACPAGEIMVGARAIYGEVAGFGTGDFMIAVAPRCQLPTGGAITEPFAPAPGTPGGVSQNVVLDCPASQGVAGVLGGAGSIVDSLALVCSPVVAIASVSPAGNVSGSQMLTINGVNLPATANVNTVVFNQGGGDIATQYVWGANATRVITRLPGLTSGLPTTVRLRNEAGTVSTAAFPIVITNGPGTPVLLSVLSGCGAGTPITSITANGAFAIDGEGIDTSGTTIVWTLDQAPFTQFLQTGLASSAGPTGGVCSFPVTGAPAGLTPGNWRVEIYTTVGGFPSALSNGIVVTVP